METDITKMSRVIAWFGPVLSRVVTGMKTEGERGPCCQLQHDMHPDFSQLIWSQVPLIMKGNEHQLSRMRPWEDTLRPHEQHSAQVGCTEARDLLVGAVWSPIGESVDSPWQPWKGARRQEDRPLTSTRAASRSGDAPGPSWGPQPEFQAFCPRSK